MIRVALLSTVFLALVSPVAAHHGGGTFDGSKEIKLTGTFTGLDLVNPHSWIYFEVKGPDGSVIPAELVHRTHLGSLNGFLATVTTTASLIAPPAER